MVTTMSDFVLASLHHLIVFGIASVMAAELALLRPAAMSPQTVRLLGRFDAVYGILALSIVVAGFVRVWYGAKGPDFYLHNPVFWAKIAAFSVIGALSVGPSKRILTWQKAAKADSNFVPPLEEVAKLRRKVLAEIHVFALIPILAAAMARGIGY